MTLTHDDSLALVSKGQIYGAKSILNTCSSPAKDSICRKHTSQETQQNNHIYGTRDSSVTYPSYDFWDSQSLRRAGKCTASLPGAIDEAGPDMSSQLDHLNSDADTLRDTRRSAGPLKETSVVHGSQSRYSYRVNPAETDTLLARYFADNMSQHLRQAKEDIRRARRELEEIEEELSRQERTRARMTKAHAAFEKNLAERRKLKIQQNEEDYLIMEEDRFQQLECGLQDCPFGGDSSKPLASKKIILKAPLVAYDTDSDDKNGRVRGERLSSRNRLVRLNLSEPTRESLWKLLKKTCTPCHGSVSRKVVQHRAKPGREKAARWAVYEEFNVSQG